MCYTHYMLPTLALSPHYITYYHIYNTWNWREGECGPCILYTYTLYSEKNRRDRLCLVFFGAWLMLSSPLTLRNYYERTENEASSLGFIPLVPLAPELTWDLERKGSSCIRTRTITDAEHKQSSNSTQYPA
jgi:hypothetical protein